MKNELYILERKTRETKQNKKRKGKPEKEAGGVWCGERASAREKRQDSSPRATVSSLAPRRWPSHLQTRVTDRLAAVAARSALTRHAQASGGSHRSPPFDPFRYTSVTKASERVHRRRPSVHFPSPSPQALSSLPAPTEISDLTP